MNKELLADLKEDIETGKEENMRVLADSVIENEKKISHHGKRAEAIVKAMLQHSRSGSGVKEPTDLNALADEYLRLAYHGLRAKDKTFNATLKTHFDPTISKVNLVPQDIGRVLLNLFNNAFYAVQEKKKLAGEGFEPLIVVTTKKAADKIRVRVKDNGMGISKSLQDKIFQPFFTTKPTGEGTGLGLSLSYDIIKAHGGALTVHSINGEGATFYIELPVR